MSKTEEKPNIVRQRIEEMKEASVEDPTTPQAMMREVLSTPANAHGSVNAAVNAALLNTQLAVTSLKSAGRDLFPQGRNLYFDNDLMGVPFMLAEMPHVENVVNNFKPTELVGHVMFPAYLLDETYITTSGYDVNGIPIVTGYNGPQPRKVDVELAGAYVQNTFFDLPETMVLGRIWTMAYNEKVIMKQGAKKGEPARMLRYWEPQPIEKQGAF